MESVKEFYRIDENVLAVLVRRENRRGVRGCSMKTEISAVISLMIGSAGMVMIPV